MARVPTVTAPRSLAAQQRRGEVLKLRMGGMKFEDIAAELVKRGVATEGSYLKQHAYRDLRLELAEMRRVSTELREEVRQVELERLDQMLKKLWDEYDSAALSTPTKDGETQGPALWILDRILKIQERRAKYLGLDEPTKHALGFDDTTLNKIVMRILGVIQERVTDQPTLALIAQDLTTIDWSETRTPAIVEITALTAEGD